MDNEHINKSSEYKKQYNKDNYKKYSCYLRTEESQLVDEFLEKTEMSKSELLKTALLFYIDHH